MYTRLDKNVTKYLKAVRILTLLVDKLPRGFFIVANHYFYNLMWQLAILPAGLPHFINWNNNEKIGHIEINLC